MKVPIIRCTPFGTVHRVNADVWISQVLCVAPDEAYEFSRAQEIRERIPGPWGFTFGGLFPTKTRNAFVAYQGDGHVLDMTRRDHNYRPVFETPSVRKKDLDYLEQQSRAEALRQQAAEGTASGNASIARALGLVALGLTILLAVQVVLGILVSGPEVIDQWLP